MTPWSSLNGELQDGQEKHRPEKELNSIRVRGVALRIVLFDVRDVARQMHSLIDRIDARWDTESIE